MDPSAADPGRRGTADLGLAVLHRLVRLRLVLPLAADPERLTRLGVLHVDTLATQALHQLRLPVQVVSGLLTVALLLRRPLLARLLRRLDLRRVVRVALDLDRLPRLRVRHPAPRAHACTARTSPPGHRPSASSPRSKAPCCHRNRRPPAPARAPPPHARSSCSPRRSSSCHPRSQEACCTGVNDRVNAADTGPAATLFRMRVLVAEDERGLADLVAEGLRKHAMAVDVVYDGADATEKLAVHGDDVCRELAQSGARTRILMLTAAAAVSDRVTGLGLGADDYLPKPFDYAEMVARVQALGRRSQSPTPPILERHGIVVDTQRVQAFRDGRFLRLTLKEYAVLETLMKADGTVVSAETLLESAWDENADPFSTVVRVIISRLRSKLGDPPCIETVAGAGYRL